jgi:hypothetical protein
MREALDRLITVPEKDIHVGPGEPRYSQIRIEHEGPINNVRGSVEVADNPAQRPAGHTKGNRIKPA